ncbi:hypothetical protein QE152_g9340 [Popillia japonica]|uniref:Retrotransposon gag domain-containing protein n=1 Tax=Popillia japonica TaxID=7064 RepID=A0AAW1LV40_POPJA
MGSEAYDIACDKISPEKPNKKSFRFQQCKQHEGENALEYLTELQRLATTCKFGDYLKKPLRNWVVFGLHAQNIQSRLLEQRDLTLERATEIAVGMETSARDAAQLHSGNASGNVNSVSLKM